MQQMLKAEDLAYTYPGNSKLQFPDIQCEAGEHWLLLGQSGSGKTTLLQLLAGLRTPQRGSVRLGNTVFNDLSPSKLDVFRGRHIGIIFQQSHFIRALNVEENLLLAQHLAGLSVDRKKIKSLLSRLQIAHKSRSGTGDLSMGEQQRVAIARALVNEPLLILADEPTSALDDYNTERVLQLLREQAEAANAILLIVTHDGRLKERFDKKILLQSQNGMIN